MHQYKVCRVQSDPGGQVGPTGRMFDTPATRDAEHSSWAPEACFTNHYLQTADPAPAALCQCLVFGVCVDGPVTHDTINIRGNDLVLQTAACKLLILWNGPQVWWCCWVQVWLTCSYRTELSPSCSCCCLSSSWCGHYSYFSQRQHKVDVGAPKLSQSKKITAWTVRAWRRQTFPPLLSPRCVALVTSVMTLQSPLAHPQPTIQKKRHWWL